MPFLMALASSVLYGVADFFGGIGSRRSPAVVVTAWFQVAGILPLLLYAALAPGVPHAADLAWGAAAGVAGGMGVLLLYHALATGVVSTAAPLISMVALTVPVMVGLALGERPGAVPLLGIVVGCGAVVLISAHGEPPEAGAPRGPGSARARLAALAPACASGVLIGLFLVFLGRVQAGSGGWPLVMGRATATVCAFALLLARRLPLLPSRGTWPFILGAAVTDVSANVFYLLSVQRAPMSLIATLVSLAPATTVLLAQLLLRERLSAKQRSGVALALVAVAMLSRAA